jgi:hypothetical protein
MSATTRPTRRRLLAAAASLALCLTASSAAAGGTTVDHDTWRAASGETATAPSGATEDRSVSATGFAPSVDGWVSTSSSNGKGWGGSYINFTGSRSVDFQRTELNDLVCDGRRVWIVFWVQEKGGGAYYNVGQTGRRDCTTNKVYRFDGPQASGSYPISRAGIWVCYGRYSIDNCSSIVSRDNGHN